MSLLTTIPIQSSGMLEKVLDFPSQIANSRYLTRYNSVPLEGLQEVNKIVFLGMGGSGVLGDSISILLRNLKMPVYVCKSSLAPSFVDNKSLVIAISYSGKTWETLNALHACLAGGAKVSVITSSEELLYTCKIKNIPAIQIPQNGQARASFGYLLVSTLYILYKAGIIGELEHDLAEAVRVLDEIKINSTSTSSIAQSIAHEFLRTFPIIYGEHNFSDAAALRWKHQINENAKVHCYHDVFPELLHNEVEVWNTSAHQREYSLVLLRDQRHEKEMGIKEKVDATKLLIAENTRVFEVWSQGESELARLLSLNYVGDFVSVYLALAKNIDAAATPNILRIKAVEVEQIGNNLV